MNDLQYLEILFLAAVAGYLIYKLYAILGQSEGFEGQSAQEDTDIGSPLSRNRDIPTNDPMLGSISSEMKQSLSDLQALDHTFDMEYFLEGASKAFEIILKAYTDGDAKTLDQLLKPSIYKTFTQHFNDREKRKESCENSLLRIQSTKVMSIKTTKSVVQVIVRFVSDQIFATRDADGNLVEGDPDQIEVMTDEWTFERDPQSPNPNWQLVAT